MSRSLRISRAKKQDYSEIEDVDTLLADLDEKAMDDTHLDPVLEESHTDILFEEEEYENNPSKAPRKTMPVKVTSKGKRTIHIKELDPNIIPPTIEDHMDPDHTGSKLAVIGKPGCFKKGTRVLMYNGAVKRVEDILVGDEVLGDDNTIRKVYDICRNRDIMYRINPLRGECITVNSKHILSLKDFEGNILDIPLNEFMARKDKAKYQWYHSNGEQYNFTWTELPSDDYFGFVLDGNHRFQLYDGSIVHNTGKSSLMRSLLYEKSEIFPCAQVYSGTEDSNHSYSKFIPSTFIHNSFNQSAYMDFIRRQKIAKKYLTNPWCACIWDDITEDERIFNLPLVKGTYKNGRHWKMLHLLSLQYALDIKPTIRTNIDGAFLLRETNKRNRKVLFENYASAIDDYTDFCSILDQVTNDYVSLYIHNRIQSNNFEDCVFWYKARQDIPKDFTFGCKEYWWFHQERYNPLYVDPIEV
jgi:hypothetical protein